jgi:hypothetical protein
MVPAKQLGLEGKTIQTSWGEQTVSPNGFMVREENGHIYTVAPDAQGLPIGYVPAGQQGVAENFADGKGPGRAGDSQRHGIRKGATMAELEKAAHAKGRKGQLARWQINMRNGHKK